MRRRRTRSWLSISLVLAMFLAACGDGEGGDETTVASGDTSTPGEEATTTTGEPTSLRVMFPVNSPILHGFRVAEHAGYYTDEGLEVDFQFLDGGGEVVTQLLGGNGDIANIPVGPTVEAIEQGNTDLRAVWNYVYGSIFYIAVPADSDIETAADLEGKTIGITDLAGGEVPIVRGVVQSAGLDPDTDVELVPIGAATALTVRAVEEGEVDAFRAHPPQRFQALPAQPGLQGAQGRRDRQGVYGDDQIAGILGDQFADIVAHIGPGAGG